MAITSYMPVHSRAPVSMVRGEGAYLFDGEGKRYLDFAAGIAVVALGHCHPHLVSALQTQASQLWHCSNLFLNPGLETLSHRLVEHSFADSVFFCNSGTEAVESGMKLLRKYQRSIGQTSRYRIITVQGGFHGRSMACISAGGNAVAREGFEPLLAGFDYAQFNDLASVAALVSDETAGILIEPILGEGGIHPVSKEYLEGLRKLADTHGLLLMFDEVQCGMGRTGHLFAYEHFGVVPDVVAVAKGIGGGFPLAACLASERVASCFTAGTHGTTFGANPLAMACGNAVMDVMLEAGFFESVRGVAAYLQQQLRGALARHLTLVSEVRGVGMMLGIELTVPARPVAARLREAGLLVVPALENVLRVLPPLIITRAQVDDAVQILDDVLEDVKP